MRATSQIMSISAAFSQIISMKGIHSLTNAFFSVYVIISLNIISVLQPTAAWFKGSLVSWPRARHSRTHTHQHLSPLSFPFSHSVLLSLPLSLRLSPAVPVWPRADWSQEGATFLNSGEDWVTQSQHQAPCVTRLCCFFTIAGRYDSNGILMAYSAKNHIIVSSYLSLDSSPAW